jgi:hypothetical protein
LSRSVAIAVIVTLSILMAAPIRAQTGQPFTERQCRDALSIATQVLTKYRGRISAKLVQSFGQFRESNCDLGTSFVRVEGTADDEAFSEFRVRLIALRMPEGAK